MAALETPAGELGWRAEDFTLKDGYGKPFRLYDLKGPSGTLVMFICNHCPYVRAIAGRIARDTRRYATAVSRPSRCVANHARSRRQHQKLLSHR